MLYLNGKLFNTKSTDENYEHAELVKEYRETLKYARERYGEHIVLETRQRPRTDKLTKYIVHPGTKGLLKRTTLIDDNGNAQEWIYSPTTLKTVDGEIKLIDPNLLISKGSYAIDIKRAPDLVFYLLKSKKAGRDESENKKFHFQDHVARSKGEAAKHRREAEVSHKIYTAIPEANLRTLAKSWGIGAVDTKDIDVVREELRAKLEADEKSKQLSPGSGHRGYDEFIESAEVKFNDKIAALCTDAEEKESLKYDAEHRKWVIDYKDGGSLYTIKELGADEFADPLTSLVNYLIDTPDALKKVENIMNRPAERPDGYKKPEFKLTMEKIQEATNVMTLKKYVRDYTGKETPKTMTQEEAKEILFQAFAEANAGG